MKYLALLGIVTSLTFACRSEIQKKEEKTAIPKEAPVSKYIVKNKSTTRKQLYFDQPANGRFFHSTDYRTKKISIATNRKTQFDKVYSFVDSLLKNNTLKIHPDSSLKIKMENYYLFADLANEVNQMSSLQNYLQKAKEEKQRFLDHEIVAKEIINSNRFQKLLQLLNKDKSNINYAFCEKCSSRLSKTDSTQYALHCFYLNVTLD